MHLEAPTSVVRPRPKRTTARHDGASAAMACLPAHPRAMQHAGPQPQPEGAATRGRPPQEGRPRTVKTASSARRHPNCVPKWPRHQQPLESENPVQLCHSSNPMRFAGILPGAQGQQNQRIQPARLPLSKRILGPPRRSLQGLITCIHQRARGQWYWKQERRGFAGIEQHGLEGPTLPDAEPSACSKFW